MLGRRFNLIGLLAVLLAIMAQLGAGASVPRIDPIAIATAGVICHTDGAPSKPPAHPADCLVCPLCATVHAQFAALLPPTAAPTPQDAGVIEKIALPPPPTGPPATHRPPNQPRAPPTFS